MAIKCKWNCNAAFCRDAKILAEGIMFISIILCGCCGSHWLNYECWGLSKGLFVSLGIIVFEAIIIWAIEYFWSWICWSFYASWAFFWGIFSRRSTVKLNKKSPEVRIGIEFIV